MCGFLDVIFLCRSGSCFGWEELCALLGTVSFLLNSGSLLCNLKTILTDKYFTSFTKSGSFAWYIFYLMSDMCVLCTTGNIVHFLLNLLLTYDIASFIQKTWSLYMLSLCWKRAFWCKKRGLSLDKNEPPFW